jgi:type IV pilus assembly protein PilM
MATQPGVWGIDLGQCALKALRVEAQGDDIVATAFDYVEHPKILSQPDADPDQLTREALEKFLSRNSLRGDLVAISVPGQSGLARFVKLPPVEEKKIVDIVRFEAKQQIPFNLDEVVWDYQKIGAGMVTDGFAMDTEIGLFAIKRDIINHSLQHFKDVNVEVQIVQMAPLALCNYVSYDLLGKDLEGGEGGKKQCIVALDIGADSSNLVITDGKRIIWQRHVPLGGNHFTRALTKDLKLTFAKAEHLKRNATKSVDKNIDLKKILAALKPVLNDFVGEVQRSLGYFMNTHRDAQIAYMVGLGSAFRLPGLQRFLGEKLQLDVRKLQKLERLTGDSVMNQPAFNENVMSFAVAYGLALQGIKHARLLTNLLPPEIQVDRLIRAKKPWAVAAAASLLFGAGILTLGYAMDYRSFGAPVVDDAKKLSKTVVGEAAAGKKQYDDEQKKVDDEERAVKSIIAGQEERLNWAELQRFIAEVLPRPDGSNLLSPDFMRLYGKDEARKAYQQYLQRQNGKTAGDKEDPDAGIEDLVLVNVETVDARYTDNLTATWDQIKASKDFATAIVTTIRPADMKDTPPDGKGWVVELRGFTQNKGKEGFIIESLVENIARNIKRTQPAAAASGATSAAATPPVAAAPVAAAAPAAGAPADAGAKPTDKDTEAVRSKVSHVLLYKASGTTSIAQASVLPSIVVGGSSGGGDTTPGGGASPGGAGGSSMDMMKGGMMPGAGGTGKGGRDGWTSLLTGGGSSLGGGGTGYGMGSTPPPGTGSTAGGMSAQLKGLTQPPGGGSGGARPGAGTGGSGIIVEGATTSTGADANKAFHHDRTEFIVLFFWKEATPSDELMKLAGDSGGSSTTTTTSTAPAGVSPGGVSPAK